MGKENLLPNPEDPLPNTDSPLIIRAERAYEVANIVNTDYVNIGIETAAYYLELPSRWQS